LITTLKKCKSQPYLLFGAFLRENTSTATKGLSKQLFLVALARGFLKKVNKDGMRTMH
jgi:hypothetical protein